MPSANTNDPVTRLADVGCEIAMRSAADWLRSHPEAKADVDTLCQTLRANLKIRMPAALEDGRKAVEAGMGAAAEATFRASMVLAGVEAAKEAAVLR